MHGAAWHDCTGNGKPFATSQIAPTNASARGRLRCMQPLSGEVRDAGQQVAPEVKASPGGPQANDS